MILGALKWGDWLNEVENSWLNVTFIAVKLIPVWGKQHSLICMMHWRDEKRIKGIEAKNSKSQN